MADKTTEETHDPTASNSPPAAAEGGPQPQALVNNAEVPPDTQQSSGVMVSNVNANKDNAPVTDHDLLNLRREWRRLADECKKAIQNVNTDDQADVAQLYYSAVESHEKFLKNINEYIAQPDVPPKSLELRKAELETIPKEKETLDTSFKAFSDNQKLMEDLAKSMKKNAPSKRGSSRAKSRSSQRSSILRKQLELEQAEKEAEIDRKIKQAELELRKKKEQAELDAKNAEAALLKKKEQAELDAKNAEAAAAAQLEELKRQKDLEKKRMELKLLQADDDLSTTSSYQYTSSTTTGSSRTVSSGKHHLKKPKTKAKKPDLPTWMEEDTPAKPDPLVDKIKQTGIVDTPATGCFGPAESYLMAKMLSEVGPEHKFDGNSLKYTSFKNKMNRLASEYSQYPGMLLEVLMNRCGGDALEAIEFCGDISPASKAFKEAMKRLELFYGNRMEILDSHTKNIGRKDVIKYDSKGFQKLLTELHNFQHVFMDGQNDGALRSTNLIRKIIHRLPYKSREVLTRDLEKCGKQVPTFKELLSFVEHELKHVTNPLIKRQEDDTGGGDKKPSGYFQRGKGGNKRFDNNRRLNTAQTSSEKTPNKTSCPLCKDQKHTIYRCSQFLDASNKERWNIVNHLKLCHACLKTGHRKGSEKCTVKKGCKTCDSQRHNSLLCPNSDEKQNGSISDTAATTPKTVCAATTEVLNSVRVNVSPGGKSLLPILPVSVRLPGRGKIIEVNAMLDCGCDGTLITNNLQEKLGANVKKKVKLLINHALGSEIVDAGNVSALQVKGIGPHSSWHILREIECVEKLPSHGNPIGYQKIDKKRFSYLQDVDIPSYDDKSVDLIIGTNNEHLMVMQDRKAAKDGNGPAAWLTPLGWTLVGKDFLDTKDDEFTKEVNCAHITRMNIEEPITHAEASYKQIAAYNAVCSGKEDTCALLHKEVQRMLQGEPEEEYPDDEDDAPSREDIVAMKIMEDGASYTNGRWCVPLPLKSQEPDLPDNRSYAVKRLLAVRNTLHRKPELAEFYIQKMDELKEKYLEVVPDEEIKHPDIAGLMWYLIHFCTLQIKPRVVYDGPAVYQGCSLNACLYQGPDNLQQLGDVLVRFRQHKIAFVCDIKEMFLQFEIPAHQRDLLRILWFENNDLNGRILTFRLKRLPYGLNCSMAIASLVLSLIAEANRTNASPETLQILSENFYVDDGLGCAEDEDDAERMAWELIEILKDSGLLVHKFISNSKTLMDKLDNNMLAPEVRNVDLSKEDIPNHKVLGVFWNPSSDCFVVKVDIQAKPSTKRGCWSMISQVYDPIGMCQPYILSGKQILQEVCEQVAGWDDPLPGNLEKKWKRWIADLKHLENISVPRCFTSHGRATSYQLHTFVDASTAGKGAVAYLRAFHIYSGKYEVAFVSGRARVVSKGSTTTVPKLELGWQEPLVFTCYW